MLADRFLSLESSPFHHLFEGPEYNGGRRTVARFRVSSATSRLAEALPQYGPWDELREEAIEESVKLIPLYVPPECRRNSFHHRTRQSPTPEDIWSRFNEGHHNVVEEQAI